MRFARLRMEKRHNYLRKVCETATSMFIANDKCSVNALILAGSADFKTDMEKSQMFDPRLSNKVVKVVDVSYGGVNGLNQAIELAQEAMTGFKYVQEKKLISGFFSDISQDSGKVVYGISETMAQLEAGTLEQIICWENLNVIRLVLKNKETDSLSTMYVHPEKVDDQSLYKDRRSGEELEMVSDEPLNEWLVENYMKFGAQLQLVTDKSSEGFQFVKGFQGIGGFLRFKLEQEHFMPSNNHYEDEDDFI